MSFGQQSGVVAEGVYDSFRKNGAPTYYDPIFTPWQADILEAGFIFAFGILGLSFFFILPGIHGRERFFTFIWVTLSLTIGAIILITNFSHDWEVASTTAETKYKAGTGKDITANIGIHIGLRGINVTLKGIPENQLNETINYNEDFSWTWRQGRIGFGPFASAFNQEFRRSQFRGLPLPILWVAEYFTFDGEGVRWGRFYRNSGLYAHMCLWLAQGTWLLTNIMFLMLIRYGSYMLIMTGLSMCTANAIKHWLRNPFDLMIPFSSQHVLKLEYGVAFWLCFATGLFCIVSGLIVLVLDLRFPSVMARFFGVDVLQDDDLIYKESSNLSKASASTAETEIEDETELREIRTVGIGGTKTHSQSDNRPRKSQNSSKRASPIRSNGKLYDEWTDYTSESDQDASDDEKGKPKETKKQKSQGFISRFQRPRRQPSATRGPRRSPVAWGRIRRVSPATEQRTNPRWRN